MGLISPIAFIISSFDHYCFLLTNYLIGPFGPISLISPIDPALTYAMNLWALPAKGLHLGGLGERD